MEYNQIISINDLNQGAIDEIVQAKLPEILNNLADENTKWNVDRGMDIKIRFKLNSEERDTMTTTVEVIPKMAPPKAHEAVAHLSQASNGIQAFSIQADEKQPELDNVHDFKEEAASND